MVDKSEANFALVAMEFYGDMAARMKCGCEDCRKLLKVATKIEKSVQLIAAGDKLARMKDDDPSFVFKAIIEDWDYNRIISDD